MGIEGMAAMGVPGAGLDTTFIAGAARDVGIIFAFRALPVLVWVALSGRASLFLRAAAGASLVALLGVSATNRVLPVGALLLAYVYFAAVGSSARFVARQLEAGRMTRPAAFVTSATFFLLLPAGALAELGRVEVLMLGWDMTLSWYSYCVETAQSREKPRLSDGLLFVLVNPVLVYPHRGREVGPPGIDAMGSLRIAAGVSTLFVSMVLLRGAHALASQPSGSALAGALVVTGGFAVLRFLAEYARHSGLASLQIGLMRQLGYVVPERYTWPIFATSPIEFWRRWNTYVGSWVLRYVYSPAALRLGRRVGATHLRFAQAGGVAATFVVVGLLHDVVPYLTMLSIAPRSLAMFAASGALVLLWFAVGEWLSRLPVVTKGGHVLGEVASGVAFWATTLVLFTWWVQ